MRYVVRIATAALLLGGMASASIAQGTDEGFFKSPVFLFMPGVVTTNAISGVSGTSAESGFLLRFQTTLPTATPWFTPVFGTQWTPNGIGSSRDNSLAFFYGFVFPVVQPAWTDGLLAVTVDPLGVFAPGGGNQDRFTTETNPKPYGHDFVLEAAVVLNFGAKMMAASSPFSKLAAYLLFDQKITNIPSGEDKFSPTLLYGLALPIAPWK